MQFSACSSGVIVSDSAESYDRELELFLYASLGLALF